MVYLHNKCLRIICYELGYNKMCIMLFANNKGAGQPFASMQSDPDLCCFTQQLYDMSRVTRKTNVLHMRKQRRRSASR